MYCFRPALDKITNPDLARAALRDANPYGEFKAYVRLAEPNKPPSYMKVVDFYAPNLLKGRIASNKIGKFADDANVLSVELCEHITSSVA